MLARNSLLQHNIADTPPNSHRSTPKLSLSEASADTYTTSEASSVYKEDPNCAEDTKYEGIVVAHFEYNLCNDEDEDLDFYRSLYFDFKTYFIRVISKVANKYLPRERRIEFFERDLGGLNQLFALCRAFGLNLEEPNPVVKTNHEKEVNFRYLLEHCEFIDPEIVSNLEPDKYLPVLMTSVLRYLLVSRCEYLHRSGEQALEIFFNKFKISVDPEGDQEGLAMIDADPSAFRRIIQKEFPDLLEKFDRQGRDCVNSQATFEHCLKFFDLYLGVPAILHPSLVNFSVDQRAEPSLYQFVHLLYCAEIFHVVQRAQRKQPVKGRVGRLNETVAHYVSLEEEQRQLGSLSEQYYQSLQEDIGRVQQLYREVCAGSPLTWADHSNTLQTVLVDATNRHSTQFVVISRLTARVNMRAQIWCAQRVVPVARKHKLDKLELCFQTLIKWTKRAERKVEELSRQEELKEEFMSQFNKKNNSIELWVRRWEERLVESAVESNACRFNRHGIERRQRLIQQFHRELIRTKEDCKIMGLLAESIKGMAYETERESMAYRKPSDAATMSGVSGRPLSAVPINICTAMSNAIARKEDIESLEEKFNEAQAELSKLEEEARDIDSRLHYQAKLMNSIKLQLHQFYAYFSKRPSLTSKKEYQTMRGYANDATDKLFEVARDIDTVYSLDEYFGGKMKTSQRPENFYTCLTVRKMTQHWENVLHRQREMDDWLEDQGSLLSKLESEDRSELTNLLQKIITEIWDHITPFGEARCRRVDGSALKQQMKKCEQTAAWLAKMRAAKSGELYELARPLQERGLTTPRLPELMECWDQCLAFLELLAIDTRIQQQLTDTSCLDVASRRLYVEKSLEAFNAKLGASPFWSPSSKIEEEELKIASEPSLTIANKFDPHRRLGPGLFTYLLVRGNTKLSTANQRRLELDHCFGVVTDGKPYVLEKQLRTLVNRELWDFSKKHLIEYFGPKNSDDEDERCYDTKRFVCSLLGLHKKLPVAPNY